MCRQTRRAERCREGQAGRHRHTGTQTDTDTDGHRQTQGTSFTHHKQFLKLLLTLLLPHAHQVGERDVDEVVRIVQDVVSETKEQGTQSGHDEL